MTHRIGIIGLGKIARDQHLPVIAADPAFVLAATASQRGETVPGEARSFVHWQDMLEQCPELDAVAICTPPQVRHHIARAALAAGKHVLLEKPPAATLSELADLRRAAERAGRVLFATWHSQYNPAVEAARQALAGQSLASLQVTWKEDVRHWHPGQEWIWQPGGFGVFDPGINALSIVTRIVPEAVFVAAAELSFPSDKDAPIAASLRFAGGAAAPAATLGAEFDWRHTGVQTWDIEVSTTSGRVLKLSEGGSKLAIDGQAAVAAAPEEYQRIYRHFDTLLSRGTSDVDEQPLQLVADAFLVGRRLQVEAFGA